LVSARTTTSIEDSPSNRSCAATFGRRFLALRAMQIAAVYGVCGIVKSKRVPSSGRSGGTWTQAAIPSSSIHPSAAALRFMLVLFPGLEH
jgi:hypothetical protein